VDRVKLKTTLNIFFRILAVIVAEALGVIGTGSLVGIETYKSCLLAGGLGVATILEALARGYLDDGILGKKEIEDAFGKINKSKD
jgi:hypothetical protein